MPNNIRQQLVFISTGDPATVNDVTPYAPGQLGASVTIKEPGPLGAPTITNAPVPPVGSAQSGDQFIFKTWQYVQTDSAMATSPFPNAVAYWSKKASYLTTTDPTQMTRGSIAGVYQGFITKGNYGFVQTGGLGRVKFIDAVNQGNAVQGGMVVGSATAGKADVIAAGTAPLYPTLGILAGNINTVDLTAIVALDVPPTF